MEEPLRTTVGDVKLISLNQIFTEESGSIVFCQKSKTFPFNPVRVYYLYDIPNQAERGGHAHKELQQILVAISGAFDVVVSDGSDKKTFNLSQPHQGLHFPPGLWRELQGFSGGAICLVIASNIYREDDYIRSYPAFLDWKSTPP
jgi:dTDP-4-dehydrorhamnose 3,5-epimerase-like enzyme